MHLKRGNKEIIEMRECKISEETARLRVKDIVITWIIQCWELPRIQVVSLIWDRYGQFVRISRSGKFVLVENVSTLKSRCKFNAKSLRAGFLALLYPLLNINQPLVHDSSPQIVSTELQARSQHLGTVRRIKRSAIDHLISTTSSW